MKKMGRVAALVILSGLFYLLLNQPQAAAQGAREGLKLCAEVAIPALFPFIVLSSAAVSMGAAGVLGRVLRPVALPLFRIGAGGASAFALGLLGGYPVGAQTVRELWERRMCSREEAERALAFCNNCGPAFVLGAAGTGVFHSSAVGAVLLAGEWLGAITVGALFRFYGSGGGSRAQTAAPEPVGAAAALTRGVHTALLAMGNVCAYTVFFRVVVRLLEQVGAADGFSCLPNGAALFTGLLDLTGGVSELAPAQPLAAELAAFLMGFGGLSVLCQTAAVLEESGLRLWPALAGKLLHGLFAALWTHLLLCTLPVAGAGTGAFWGAVKGLWRTPIWGVGLIGAVCLAILGVFMAFHSGKKGERRV